MGLASLRGAVNGVHSFELACVLAKDRHDVGQRASLDEIALSITHCV